MGQAPRQLPHSRSAKEARAHNEIRSQARIRHDSRCHLSGGAYSQGHRLSRMEQLFARAIEYAKAAIL